MKDLTELQKLLTNPFDDLSKDDLNGFQNKCCEIAESLFSNYCINCNGKEFYFAEIEFYYWQTKDYNEKWNRVTYPRIREAGKLFFHLSGIDICFNSHYDKEHLDKEAKFGGILLRAIRDKDGTITAGPWNCMLKILNECVGGNMPNIQPPRHQPCNEKEVIKPTYRSLGKEDQEEEIQMANRPQSTLKLCFYDSSIRSSDWRNQPRITLRKKTGKLEISQTSAYKLDRFELQG